MKAVKAQDTRASRPGVPLMPLAGAPHRSVRDRRDVLAALTTPIAADRPDGGRRLDHGL